MITRPFQLTDVPEVNRLHQQVGWHARSLEGWRWLAANPARPSPQAPLGWVIADEEGRAAAFVGNFIQRFWLMDRPVLGASGFSIIVPPAQRGAAPRLIRTLMRQADGDFRYTLNANPKAARLYPRMGLSPCPERGHDVKLAWIIDPVTCGWGRLLRNAVERSPGLAGRLGERLMPRNAEQIGAQPLQALPLPPGIHWISDLSDTSSLAAFWSELRGQGRLVADRSPATLRWRMADPELTVAPLLLGCEQDGCLVGYAQAVLSKGSPIEAPALEVVDLIALDRAPHAASALIKAMLRLAPRLGVARVRLQVVNGALLDALGPLARSARREGGWGHCHAHFDPVLEDAGRDWRPTPYDGDYAFCLRPLPISRRVPSTEAVRDAA
ncbi:N-acetyltransferase [Brevundimonas bullata]|uniref:N-acetyltransferase n=1 Tax=Brevundimonas bullata TaxID=13160 RepID=UPI002FD8F93E